MSDKDYDYAMKILNCLFKLGTRILEGGTGEPKSIADYFPSII